MKTVLVTGATGLLGSTLIPILRQQGKDVITNARSGRVDYKLDMADVCAVTNFLNEIKPATIVNLIGLTNVDICEAQPSSAYIMNTRVVENIAGWISSTKASCHLIQISTDQVYDGIGPHLESNPALTNYYAFSKYAGELAASVTTGTVLRTNFFGRSRSDRRKSLTDWLFHSLTNCDPIQVFEDVLFNPLSMVTLAEIIELVMMKRPAGIFNLGSHGGMSKADFAFAFAKETNLPTSFMTCTSSDKVSFLNTYRPKDMRMDCMKFESELGIKLPKLRDEIALVAREYHEEA